jgi:putative transposase
VFRHGLRPADGAADGQRPELISQALQSFCAGKVGLSYIPPGTEWNSGYIESFNNRLRR